MNQLKKHILFFDFLENHYVSNDEISKQHLSVIRKSNFVKAADKAIVRSSHTMKNSKMKNSKKKKKKELKSEKKKKIIIKLPVT